MKYEMNLNIPTKTKEKYGQYILISLIPLLLIYSVVTLAHLFTNTPPLIEFTDTSIILLASLMAVYGGLGMFLWMDPIRNITD